ncbi:MAG: hypothetical protein LBK95_09130 [Bifidobacteriaceae bacterium]|jgi:hypothetical protein|nr:hypothetical protein [Bifidobacteriaceae bacterium]
MDKPCNGGHTLRAITEVRADLDSAGSFLGQALPLIELADPAGWRSPAATAYQDWVGDLAARCRRAITLAGESVRETDTHRAMVINVLGNHE